MAGVTTITYGARREGKTWEQLVSRVDQLEQAYPVDQERVERLEKKMCAIVDAVEALERAVVELKEAT